MATYKGSAASYHQGAQLGAGGEGAVYGIQGKSDLVMKLYHQGGVSSELPRKIALMVELRTKIDRRILPSLAWPADALRDSSGSFVGFAMPKVSGVSIKECYKSDDFSLSYTKRIRIARNLCATVDAVHSIGQLIGDFNPNNILINRQTGAVSLVDTDSFHIISEKGITYPCRVGMPLYVAPELQGVDLHATYSRTYSAETDRFALAIHIFCLLMNGFHPFASRKNPINTTLGKPSVALPSPVESIKVGQSPHFSRKNPSTLAPVKCPSIAVLPPGIQALFERAFDKGHANPSARPSAAEWYDALHTFEGQVSTCTVNELHSYPSHAVTCPWCKMGSVEPSTPNLTPSRTITSSRSFQLSHRVSQNSSTRISSDDKIKRWLITIGCYIALALFHINVVVPAFDPSIFRDADKGLVRLLVWAGLLVGGFMLWWLNSTFISEWSSKGRRAWEIPVTVVSATTVCALTPFAVVALLGILFVVAVFMSLMRA